MAALTTKLNIKSGDTVETVTSYSTQDEGTVKTATGGTYWKITNNGVDAYIGLWPVTVTSGGTPDHSALQVVKDGVTYYVEKTVTNTFNLTLKGTSNQTITLKYTEPGGSQVTKTSTSSDQTFTLMAGTTYQASIAGSTYYSAGTLNITANTNYTLNADATVSAGAATHITYTITLTQKTGETVTIYYKNHNGSSLASSWSTTTASVTLGKGSQYYSTIAGSTYYSAGTITSPGTASAPNTLNAAVTISFTAATHITYKLTHTASNTNQTLVVKYKAHSGTALGSETTLASGKNVTIGKGSTWTATLTANTGCTKGTLSPGTSGTLNANTTVKATAGTVNSYTVYARTAANIQNTKRAKDWSGSYKYNTSISVTTYGDYGYDTYKWNVYKGTSNSGTLWLTKTTKAFSYNIPTSNTAIYNNGTNCQCGDCCLAEGTLIACWDNGKYIYRKIEDIQSGDIVVGANGQLNEVYARTDTILGKERAMFTFEDNSLYFTGEHSIWVRYKNEEYFGIHDISGYYREKTATVNGQPILEWEQEKTYRENGIIGKPISKGLSRDPIFVLFDAEYGTDKGWKHNRAIIAKDKVYSNDTPVHTLIVGGNHTFFANGYLVSGFATDVDYDYKNVKIEDLKLFKEK